MKVKRNMTPGPCGPESHNGALRLVVECGAAFVFAHVQITESPWVIVIIDGMKLKSTMATVLVTAEAVQLEPAPQQTATNVAAAINRRTRSFTDVQNLGVEIVKEGIVVVETVGHESRLF